MANRNDEGFRRTHIGGIRSSGIRAVASVASLLVVAIWCATTSVPAMAADPSPPVPRDLSIPPAIPKAPAGVPSVEPIPQPPPAIPKRALRETNALGMKFVLIPAGEFMMGATENTEGSCCGRSENGPHLVRITKPFYLGIYAVTQDEFQRVMKTNPSWFSAQGGGKDYVRGMDTKRFPVEQVSWSAAQEFCKELSAQEKKTYRLPTEAEWEYACRAGTTTAFNFGDSLNGSEANCNGYFPYGSAGPGPFLRRTTTVGSYQANAWGLYDMHGNVWQWCQDWFQPYYYAHSPQDDPQGPIEGHDRCARGGGWDAGAADCRSADRWKLPPDFPFYSLGFRVVEVAP